MSYQYCIISRWRNRSQVEELTKKIRSKGKSVYSFIEGDGTQYELKDDEETHEPEEFMKKYESIPNWKNDSRIREIFDVDLKALKDSENVVMLLPVGKSTHIEAGIAYGLGKNCILIGEQKETESLYLIFGESYNSIDEFVEALE